MCKMSSSKLVQNVFKGVFFGAAGIVISSHLMCLYDIYHPPKITVERLNTNTGEWKKVNEWAEDDETKW